MVTQILAVLLLAMAPATVGGDPGTRGGAMCRGEAAVVADEAEWQGTFDRDVVVASSAVVDSISLLDGDDLVCVLQRPAGALPRPDGPRRPGRGHDDHLRRGQRPLR